MRRGTIPFAIIFTVMLTAQGFNELISECKLLIDEGDLVLAEQKLQEILEQNNMFATAHYQLSRIAYMRGDLKKTGEYLRNAITSDPRNEEYRLEYNKIGEINSMMANGNRKLSGGDYEKAIIKFEQVQEKYPDFPGAPFYIGLANLRSDEIKEAAANFRLALKISPNYEKAKRALKSLADRIFNSGNQLIRGGEYDQAISEYELVLELDPNYYKAHFQLGAISTKLGDYENAIEQYKKTVEINPLYAKGWFSLGLSYQRTGQIDKALEMLTRSVEVDSGYAKAYAQIGMIYLDQKNYEASEISYNKAIQCDPNYAKPYLDLGKLYVLNERWEEAVSTLMRGTDLDGKNYIGFSILAQAYNVLGQCIKAKEAAYNSIELKSNYAAALFELGIAEKCLGNRTAALKAFEKARNDRTWRKQAEYEIEKIRHPERFEE